MSHASLTEKGYAGIWLWGRRDNPHLGCIDKKKLIKQNGHTPELIKDVPVLYPAIPEVVI